MLVEAPRDRQALHPHLGAGGSQPAQGRAPGRPLRARHRLDRRAWLHLSVRVPAARLPVRDVQHARDDPGARHVADRDQEARRGPPRRLERRARECALLARPALVVPVRRLHRRPLMEGKGGTLRGCPHPMEGQGGTERRKRIALAGVMLSIFLAAMESTVVATAMPRVVASLGGLEMYSWVFSGFLLTSTVTMPLWGRLSDLYGRRPIFLTGLVIFLVGSALSGAAQDMTQLIVFRMLQGLGAGALMPIG